MAPDMTTSPDRDSASTALPSAVGPIPIAKPYFGEDELRAVQRPLETGWVVQGPYVHEFETAFAQYTGASHAIATSSCTTALHLALVALGAGPGDEVIVPAFTWVATANVVEYVGATPIFCDIDLSTFNTSAAAIEDVVTPRTVGVIPVHLFGLAAPMPEIMVVARRHGLWVVEDAACGLGSKIDGIHVGTFGDAGCFSFHPRKSITTGEGGMITTNLARIDQATRSLRDHGASRSDLDRHHGKAGYLLPDYEVLGFNYRLTDIQAAIGVVQMQRAEWILDRRREIAATYDAALSDIEWLVPPNVPTGYVHGYQSYVTLFAPEKVDLETVDRLGLARNAFMERLDQAGIATRQGTHAAALQDFYVHKYDIRREDFPNAAIAERLSMSLPMYPQMTEDEFDRVVGAVKAEGPSSHGS